MRSRKEKKSGTAVIGLTALEDVQRPGVAQLAVVLGLLGRTVRDRRVVGADLGAGLLEVGHGWRVGRSRGAELEEDVREWDSGRERTETQARSWEVTAARVF